LIRATPNHIVRACLLLLRPLARVLLRHGVTAHQFGKMAEAAFVAAADDVLREQARSASYSRISSLTGIHRHAVSAVKAALDADEFALLGSKDYQRNRLARVLGGWFEHPDFTDRDGRPRRLPLHGPEPSFSELVRRFSGDIYPGIILDELQRAGSVRIGEDGCVRAVARRILPAASDDESLERMGRVACDVLTTLERNMALPEAERLFEDSAVSVNFPVTALPLLRRWLDRRGAPLLNDLEGWMAERESSAGGAGAGAGRVRAGVSLVMFADRPGSPQTAAPRD
jgi:hypothetical protein